MAGRGEPSPDDPLPVARVVVDVPHPHLDRPFDYLVPAAMTQAAAPGTRVRVRFAGRLVGGYLLERAAASGHAGRLAPLAGVVSPEPVLTPEVAAAARLVADRYAGTLADVLRLAVPPRHAQAERALLAAPPEPPLPPPPPDPGPWARHPAGPSFLAALAEGRSPRAVWSALPGPEWPEQVARAVVATLASDRGALVVLPDQRDVARVDAALTELAVGDRHVVLTGELTPRERYRRFLLVRRGLVRAVVGSRSAALAPVERLGLAVVWDDGDDLLAEPRAPYPHARDVVALRCHVAKAAFLLGGFARTAEGALLVRSGWARSLAADRATVRAAAPRVLAAGDDADLARDPAARAARLPSHAWQVAHEALATGPVLVQVPRAGYLPSVACVRCHQAARCPTCAGPLALGGSAATPVCRWCGRTAVGWHCPACGHDRLRANVVGAGRTAEELGRAFPSVPVRTSGGDAVLAAVDGSPALVVATPGAEPVAGDGYAAALLLDGWVLLDRPDLRAGEEALRRWMAAAALVRPAAAGGRVLLVADAALAPVQALVRWDPAGFAARELADRDALGLPPAARWAQLRGTPAAVGELLALADLPASAQVLGPVELGGTAGEPHVQAIVRTPRRDGPALASALKAAQGVRSARKAGDAVHVRVDPVEVG